MNSDLRSCATIFDKSGQPRSYAFTLAELKVGRSSSNDIRLDPVNDVTVSRKHGVFKCTPGPTEPTWSYEDLDSTQGTYLNGQRIKGVTTIVRGDMLMLGRDGPTVSLTWPVPRITGMEGTYLRSPVKQSVYFPLVFSEGFSGRFDYYTKIAAGGFGEVWKAHHNDTARVYAVKIMHPELLNADYLRKEDRDSLIARFVREAKLTHALASSGAPSIVQVHTWGDDPDRDYLYIVMDFVEGESLDKVIFRYDRIPENLAVRYLLNIAEALDYAHRFEWIDETGKHCRGVIHRDIKPNNILVDSKSNQAMIVDFGIAGIQQGGERLTASSVRVGSHQFLSLEAMENNVISPASDLWAFAVTAYLLLSRGHFPFEGREITELVKNMRENQMRPIGRYRTDLSADLVALLHSALNTDADKRPQTAGDWVTILRRLAASSPSP